MYTSLNAHKQTLWKLSKLPLTLVNSAVTCIHAFMQYFHSLLPLVTIRTGAYLNAISTADIINKKWRNYLLYKASGYSLMSIVLIGMLSVSIVSCQSHASVGIKKDLGTGLSTQYKNMEPAEAMLVMNDEVLNHTDIPMGEQFMIINKGVRGLTEKDGKISVGCSLLLTDMKGNVILNEPDLFKESGTTEADKAEYLKCIVSTGKPMNWEEKYKVKASFWDKWGDGKIVNEVTIRMIDIP